MQFRNSWWIVLKIGRGFDDKYRVGTRLVEETRMIEKIGRSEVSQRRTFPKCMISLRIVEIRIPFTNRILRVEVFSDIP